MSKASLELGGGNWAAKDGKLLGYAVGDTSGKYLPREFDFSRGADIGATRVNKDGLVEKYRENKAHYSNNFSRVSSGGGWGHAGINTLFTGQDGYDGTTNATAVFASTSTAKHQVFIGNSESAPTSVSITDVFTLSVYAKPNGYDHIVLRGDRVEAKASFNINTGVVGTRGSECITSSMTSVGNGFYRCQATFAPAGTISFIIIGMMEADDTVDFTGNTSKGYILQDAQWELGLVATDLIPTSGAAGKAGVLDNLPRIDYTSGSAQLLMEPARTNKVPYSEYFEASDWNTVGTVTLDFGYEAPDGTNSAYKVSGTTSSALYLSGAGIVAGDTRSIWAKTVSGTGTVDLLTYSGNTDNTFTVTNEWQRFELTGSPDAVGQTNIYAVDFRGFGNTLTELLLWGAQAEAGNYATSYIPTYGASDTRAKDASSITGVSSLIGSTEGTIYLEVAALANDLSDRRFALSDGTTNNVVRVGFIDVSNRIVAVLYNGTDQCELTYDGADITETNKIAFTYAANDFALYVNGESRSTDVSGVTFSAGTLSEIHFNEGDGSDNESYGKFDKVMIFPTRLTNNELSALTTL